MLIALDRSRGPSSHNSWLTGDSSKKIVQVFRKDICILQDVLENLRVKSFLCVKRDRDPLSRCILVDHVTATLARQRKSNTLQNCDDLAGVTRGTFGIKG